MDRARRPRLLQTFFWAALKGDDQVIAKTVAWDEAVRPQVQALTDRLPAESTARYSTSEQLWALIISKYVLDVSAIHIAETVAKDTANASLTVKGLTARDEQLSMHLGPNDGEVRHRSSCVYPYNSRRRLNLNRNQYSAFGLCSWRLLSWKRTMAEDHELLRSYLENQSEEAFSELVRRYLALVYGTALRRTNGNSHLAEDTAQVVFARLARNAATLTSHPVIHGWLYVAARHAAAEVMRAEQRRKNREEKVHAMHHVENVPAKEDWHRLRPELDALLDELDVRERDVVLLRFFDGRRFSEIGAALRISEDAARMRVERVIEKLRAILARRGVNSTVSALGLALTANGAITAPAGLASSIASAAMSGIAAGGTATLFTFMTTSKLVSGVLGAVAILAISCAVYQTREARQSASALATVRQERDALRTSVEPRSTASNQQFSGRKSQQSDPSATTPLPMPADATPMEYVLSHPEGRAAFVEQEALKIKTRYTAFFKSAQLSSEQQEQFLKLHKDATEAKLDFVAALRAQGYSPENMPQNRAAYPEIAKLTDAWKKDLGSNLESLLGPAGWRFYQQYERTVPERNVFDQVTSALYYTGEPLTRRQAGELLDGTLTKNRIQFQTSGTSTNTMGRRAISLEAYEGYRVRVGDIYYGGSQLDVEAPVTDAAIAHAQTFLSSTQVAVLRNVQAQQLAKIQLLRPASAKMPGRHVPSGSK